MVNVFILGQYVMPMNRLLNPAVLEETTVVFTLEAYAAIRSAIDFGIPFDPTIVDFIMNNEQIEGLRKTYNRIHENMSKVFYDSFDGEKN